MAYVLGFFTADGTMIKNKRGAHFIEFQIIDECLLKEIKRLLGSNHKISERKKSDRWHTLYRLQIGSKKIFQDLLQLGLTPRKSKRIILPDIPRKYFSHFARGYFDGDGSVVFGFYKKNDSKKPSPILLTRFTSGNKEFLKNFLISIQKYTEIKGGSIYQKQGGYDLSFSVRDSLRLYKFMYKGAKGKQFLKRKYSKFQKAIKYYGGVA